ncbi:hypothetical protein DRW41_13090 [Neobacillus piezotolerans]|uniref:Uncharacterized protein n=1 Tax=Neobacillus piezotolerans TaxID=2259171 RepID=A0A3D8GQA3_9BACI|nr:hypothetical protein [Neobacillus piezotolerans]RDU36461.1 hypothetical protein DRW41_13090 [Neobacillus piezotolerans]
MKIADYYFQCSKASLNSSLLFLFPGIMLIILNILFWDNKQAMMLCLPSVSVSIIYFQQHLMDQKKAFNAAHAYGGHLEHFLNENSILLFYEAKLNPGLLLFSKNGAKVGELRNNSRGLPLFRRKYELTDGQGCLLAHYINTPKGTLVYDSAGRQLGGLFKTKGSWTIRDRGNQIASIDSARLFMDLKIIGKEGVQRGRLRRGMMPIEWKTFSADPNSPVFTLHPWLSDEERLLYMAVLVKEFFVDR